MQDSDLHLQRLLDGALAAPAAAGVASQVASDAALTARMAALKALDGDLQALSRPLTADQHQHLLSRIAEVLPRTAPAVYARIRPADILLTGAVLSLLAICFATAGSIIQGSTALVALACLGVVAGTMILILVAMVRRAQRGFLRNLLGNPVSLGPADLLVYRALGIGLALGGLYLAHLA